MKTTWNVTKGLMLGLIVLALPLTLAAQRGPGGGGQRGNGGPNMGGPGPGMAFLPNLTDQQQADIQKIHLAARKDMLLVQNKVVEKSLQLDGLYLAGGTDTKAINATIDEIYKLKGDLAKRRAQTRQEVRKLLTEEQRVVFDSHTPGMGDGYGRGFGGRGGQGRGRGTGAGDGCWRQ